MRIGFGCVKLGSASHGRTERSDVRLIEEAIDRGVRTFDTADVYGSGSSERILGRGIRHHRAEVVIATKAGYVFRPRSRVEQSARKVGHRVRAMLPSGQGGSATASPGGGSYAQQDFSPQHLRRALDASLRRLGTDYVDVFQLHGPPRALPGLLAELHDLVDSGKVRRFGVGAESVTSATEWAAVDGVEIVQLPFGVLDPEAAGDVFPETAARGIEVWARGVLGGGVLRAGAPPDDPKRPLVDALERLARQHGIDVYQLAVGFVRSYPEITTVLIGISSEAHLRRNMELMAGPPLDAELLVDLLALLAPGGSRP